MVIDHNILWLPGVYNYLDLRMYLNDFEILSSLITEMANVQRAFVN